MDAFISQIPSLDATDIASILRQVQGGSLTLEDAFSTANQPNRASQDDNKDVEPNIIETVHHAAEIEPTFEPLSPSRHMSLKRPGRPLQSLMDIEIPVPQSKTELHKQIFQARMMGAPHEVAERITQKTGLGSPPHVKPNVGLSRSLSHPVDHDKEKRGHSGGLPEEELCKDNTRGQSKKTSLHTVETVKSPAGGRTHSSSSKSTGDNCEQTNYKSYKSRGEIPERSGSPARRDVRRADRGGWSGDRRHHSRERSSKDSQETSRMSSNVDRSSRNHRPADTGTSKIGGRNRASSNTGRSGHDHSPRGTEPTRGNIQLDKSEPQQSDTKMSRNAWRRAQKRAAREHYRDEKEKRRRLKKEAADPQSQNKQKESNSSIRFLLSGITAVMEHKKIQDHFGVYGNVTDLVLAPSQGCGYIDFKNVSKKKDRLRNKRLLTDEHYMYDTFIVPTKVDDSEQESCKHTDEIEVTEDKTKAPAVDKSSEDRVVHSQVDRDAASFSMETFGQFRIPKKVSSAASATAIPKSVGESNLSVNVKQEVYKRGASREDTGVLPTLPDWCKTHDSLDDLMRGDWFDNMESIRKSMPQIPSVYTYLDRDDIKELKQQYLSAVREGKQKIETGGKEFMEVKKKLMKVKKELKADRCKSIEDCYKNQKLLFKLIDLEEEFKAVTVSTQTKLTCFLCNHKSNSRKGYCRHIHHETHNKNVQCTHTSLGKMFYIKYLQKLAKNGPFKNEQKRGDDGDLFCEVCMKSYKHPKSKHYGSEEHKAALKMRPKCEVCDITFNNIKDHHQHITRQYHKNNLQRKIENGKLSADYKDPIVEVKHVKEDVEGAEQFGTEADDTSKDELPEVPMEMDDSDDEMGSMKGEEKEEALDDRHNTQSLKPLSLFQNTDRMFFGETIETISRTSSFQGKHPLILDGLVQEIRHARAKKMDSLQIYHSVMCSKLPVPNLYMGEHLSTQDIVDVVDIYTSELRDTPTTELKQLKMYYYNNHVAQEMQAGVDAEMTDHSSIPHQWSLLCQLGLEQYISGRKHAMTNWFCYVCVRYVNRKRYAQHVKDSRHCSNVVKAGTTIGNMCLIQILQSHLKTSSPETSGQTCSTCLIMHKQHLLCSECREISPTCNYNGEKDQKKPGREDKGLEPEPLFQNCCREFFGETMSGILSMTSINPLKVLADRTQKAVMRDLYLSKETYSQEEYSVFSHSLRHVSNAVSSLSMQDSINIIEEYKTKMENLYKVPSDAQFLKLLDYYRKDNGAQKIQKELRQLDRRESSVQYQLELLNQLGVSKYIRGSEGQLINLFCYVCMKQYNSRKAYNAHFRTKGGGLYHGHESNVIKAGTTIGNMFLVKFLQRYLIVDAEDTSNKQRYCSSCDVMHSDPEQHGRHIKGHHLRLRTWKKEGDFKCEVCDLSFSTPEEINKHRTSIKHNMLKAVKIEHGFLPQNFQEELDTIEESVNQDGISNLEEYTKIDKELESIGQEAMTNNIQGFFCVACNMFVNDQVGEDIKQTKEKHVELARHLKNVERYYEELDKKWMSEQQEKIEAARSAEVDTNVAMNTTPSNQVDKSMIDTSDEHLKLQHSIMGDKKDDNVQRTDSADEDNSTKTVKHTEEAESNGAWSGLDKPKKTTEARLESTTKDALDSKTETIRDGNNGTEHDVTKKTTKARLDNIVKHGIDKKSGTETIKTGASIEHDISKKATAGKSDNKDVGEHETTVKGVTDVQVMSSKDDTSQTGRKLCENESVRKHTSKTGSCIRHEKEKQDTTDVKSKKSARDENVTTGATNEQTTNKDNKDVAEKHEQVVWDSSIKLVRCSVVIKRLSASEISRYCQKNEEDQGISESRGTGDDGSRTESREQQIESEFQKPGPKSSKMKAKKRIKRRLPSSDKSSDSEDLPLSEHQEKCIKVGKKLKKRSTEGTLKRRLPSFDSSSDNEELRKNVQSRKSLKNRKELGWEKHGENSHKRKPSLSSSDSSSDIEELLQRKTSVKIRRKLKGGRSEGSALQRKLSSDNSSDSEGLHEGLHSKKSVKDKRTPKTKNIITVKSKNKSLRRTSSTEDSVFVLDPKSETRKSAAQKERTNSSTSASSRLHVRDKSASTAVDKHVGGGISHKKNRTSSSGNSVTGASNVKIRNEPDDKGRTRHSISVSSNPDMRQSSSSVGPNSTSATHIEKSQSGNRRNSVGDVDIADILFRDSYSLKPTKKTSGKAKVMKTGDSSKQKMTSKDSKDK